ncbi:MAG: SsgA family sporulation/cell division regulator [Nocardioides sp.]
MKGCPARLTGMTSQPTSRVLEQPVAMQCVDRHGRAIELDVIFEYDPVDPYAVWVRFPRSIRWAMCRSLLSRGLTDACGDGDVRITPGVDRTGRSVVVLEFRSPDGYLIGRAGTSQVFRFLTRTLAAVPFGTETVDVDALIRELLADL